MPNIPEELLDETIAGAEAVEAFVKWTRDFHTPELAMTLEARLCSCAAPAITQSGSPEEVLSPQTCPWCELRKAFGLLEDV